MNIQDFGIERWMDLYENKCRYNLAETCVESLTVAHLLQLANKKETLLADILPMKLTYGAITGSERLKTLVAGLYERQSKDNVLITHGAIGANALVYETLIEPGDHVVAVSPTYQQHHSIPESYGASVSLWPLKEELGFMPDLKQLKQLVNPQTKLIAINNPNNPTGALMDKAFLNQIIDIARANDAYILCDEVYRGIDQQGDGFTASIADLYEKGISTSSMSKAYSLAGLRLGWVVCSPELISTLITRRDYNTISVGMLDDYFAVMALEVKDKILGRSREITQNNLAMLDEWIASEPRMSYIRPKSGTTALLKYDFDMTSWDFCVRLVETTGVMLSPGSVLNMEGYLRIGYANNPEILRLGLIALSGFLRTLDAEANVQ